MGHLTDTPEVDGFPKCARMCQGSACVRPGFRAGLQCDERMLERPGSQCTDPGLVLLLNGVGDVYATDPGLAQHLRLALRCFAEGVRVHEQRGAASDFEVAYVTQTA